MGQLGYFGHKRGSGIRLNSYGEILVGENKKKYEREKSNYERKRDFTFLRSREKELSKGKSARSGISDFLKIGWLRGEERFREEGETAKKDREEGERKQKNGRWENQHEKGRRENVL